MGTGERPATEQAERFERVMTAIWGPDYRAALAASRGSQDSFAMLIRNMRRISEEKTKGRGRG